MKVTFDTVRKLGMQLPDVEVTASRGVPALKVRGKMLTCPAINKSAEPGSIVVRIDADQRDEFIAANPDTYYITDHYLPFPSVLVRLSRIAPDALRDLLRMSWKYVTTKKGKTK